MHCVQLCIPFCSNLFLLCNYVFPLPLSLISVYIYYLWLPMSFVGVSVFPPSVLQCPLPEPSACSWEVIWLWSFLCTTLAAVLASQKRMSMLTWHPSNYRGMTGLSSWRKKKIRHKKLKLVKQLDCKNVNKKIWLLIAQIELCTKQKVPVNSDFLFYFFQFHLISVATTKANICTKFFRK